MAPKRIPLCAQLCAIGAFMRSFQDTPVFASAQEEQFIHAMNVIQESDFDFEMAADAVQQVKLMPFDSVQMTALINGLRAQVRTSTPGQSSARRCTQDYLNLPNFFTKRYWVQAPGMQQQERLTEILAVATKAGMRCPTEHSKAMILILTLGEDFERLSGPQKHEAYKVVAKEVNAECNKAPNLPHAWVDTLPLFVDFLPAAWRDMVLAASPEGERPIPCPMLTQLKCLAKQVPVRSTNNMSKGLQLPQLRLAAAGSHDNMHGLLTLEAGMQQQQQQQQHGLLASRKELYQKLQSFALSDVAADVAVASSAPAGLAANVAVATSGPADVAVATSVPVGLAAEVGVATSGPADLDTSDSANDCSFW
jgi:hypothetical protein